jgi:hypothetical protein
MKKIAVRIAQLVVVSLTLNLCLQAQNYSQKDRGLVFYKLGSDTITTQYFEFDRKKIHSTIVNFTGSVTKYEAEGELDEVGDIKHVFSKIFTLDSSGNWILTTDATNIFTGDSSVYTARRVGKEVIRRAVAGKGIISNAADAASVIVFPYMGFFAPRNVGDTLFHCQLVFGECRKYQVARLGKNELNVGSTAQGRLKLFVDEHGRMQGGDAIGSSVNWIASVERQKKNYGEYLNLMAQRRWSTGALAPRTFRDTARLALENNKIEVDYWRPYRRNREIFGAVVPWNRVWRTGANNATQLRSDEDLDFSGHKLSKGKYSIWTYPTQQGWELILNKQADIWGTEYDSTANLFEVPLIVEKTAEPVEVMKISLLPEDNHLARLLIEWEYYKAWANFKIEN